MGSCNIGELEESMPKYIIERNIRELVPRSSTVSRHCPNILQRAEGFGPQIQWIESYVTMTSSIASISLRMRRRYENTPDWASSPRIQCELCVP